MSTTNDEVVSPELSPFFEGMFDVEILYATMKDEDYPF